MDILDKVDLYQVALEKLRPFEGNLLKQIQDYYRVNFTWSSNALEGNTLTLSETKVILEDGLTIGGKPLKDIFEAVGHAEAYNFIFELIKDEEITENDVLNMHRMFYRNIDESNAGQYRTQAVMISGSNYPVCAIELIQDEMKELFLWAKECRNDYHPVEFAAQLHKRFVFIHPFIDGNGRVARLLMNTVLLQDGYMLATINPEYRSEYTQALEDAHTNDTPFLQFIGERIHDTQKEVMRLLNIDFPE